MVDSMSEKCCFLPCEALVAPDSTYSIHMYAFNTAVTPIISLRDFMHVQTLISSSHHILIKTSELSLILKRKVLVWKKAKIYSIWWLLDMISLPVWNARYVAPALHWSYTQKHQINLRSLFMLPPEWNIPAWAGRLWCERSGKMITTTLGLVRPGLLQSKTTVVIF